MKILSILLILFVGYGEGKDIQKAEIKTSAICDHCKVKIDKKLREVEGVKYGFLEIKTMNVKVKYDASVVTLNQIRTILNEMGYDADDQKAPAEAYDRLDQCCKPGGDD